MKKIASAKNKANYLFFITIFKKKKLIGIVE